MGHIRETQVCIFCHCGLLKAFTSNLFFRQFVVSLVSSDNSSSSQYRLHLFQERTLVCPTLVQKCQPYFCLPSNNLVNISDGKARNAPKKVSSEKHKHLYLFYILKS